MAIIVNAGTLIIFYLARLLILATQNNNKNVFIIVIFNLFGQKII